MRPAHHKFCLRKWTYIFTTRQARHSDACFDSGGELFLSIHSPLISWSEMLQPGSDHFQQILLRKGTEGVLPRFTVWWHRSAMPFPAEIYAQRNCRLILQSFAKALNSLIQKAVSLSVRSLCGELCSKNTVYRWWITLAEFCLANFLQIEKCNGP